jgi:hypothetical protein
MTERQAASTYVEHRNSGKNEETPLVRGGNQGTDETGDDHDEIEKDNTDWLGLNFIDEQRTHVRISERGRPVPSRISRRRAGVVIVQSMYRTY